ncbi:MBL fold metallo-hydrolase [Shimia biformata]|uniref:MBL fold metallo-hydrolase n=1 Tax=Shimia biformata TaxID=1294299 RepID=UPI00194E2138|nr:MBL fold metallo-hydrolase [Shimia biformata]
MQLSRRTALGSLLAAPVVLTAGRGIAADDMSTPASPPTGQVPGIYRYALGDITVTSILDGYGAGPADMVIGYEDAAARAAHDAAHHPFVPGQVTTPVNAFILETPQHLVAIDTGMPGFAGQTYGAFQRLLAAAGYRPEDFDALLMTHLHTDHVGGLLDADGAPAFANAELVVAAEEWAFTHDDAVFASLPEQFQQYFALSRNMVAPYAGRRREFSGEAEVLPGIAALPLPGHTPGHTGFVLSSGGRQLLIWGDVVHVPAVQFSEPGWAVVYDADVATAVATRQRLLDQLSTDGIEVAGMHLDFPAIGFVDRTPSAYRWVQSPWQYSG